MEFPVPGGLGKSACILWVSWVFCPTKNVILNLCITSINTDTGYLWRILLRNLITHLIWILLKCYPVCDVAKYSLQFSRKLRNGHRGHLIKTGYSWTFQTIWANDPRAPQRQLCKKTLAALLFTAPGTWVLIEYMAEVDFLIARLIFKRICTHSSHFKKFLLAIIRNICKRRSLLKIIP